MKRTGSLNSVKSSKKMVIQRRPHSNSESSIDDTYTTPDTVSYTVSDDKKELMLNPIYINNITFNNHST